MIQWNAFGAVAVTNAMLGLLRKSAAACILNVSSGPGSITALSDPDSQTWQYANLLAYNSSKAALNAITQIYASTLRSEGITVNAIDPGYVATDPNNHAGHLPAEQAAAAIAQRIAAPGTGLTGAFLAPDNTVQPR